MWYHCHTFYFYKCYRVHSKFLIFNICVYVCIDSSFTLVTFSCSLSVTDWIVSLPAHFICEVLAPKTSQNVTVFVHTQRKDHVRTQWESNICKQKGNASGENKHTDTLIDQTVFALARNEMVFSPYFKLEQISCL